MPNRPSLPIPENLTPETCCLCIQMPQDPTWKAVIAGLLFQPAEWFNWQRDDEKSGKILAQYWRNIYENIDWSIMSCCCDQIPLSRFTSDGTYQTSTDGGATWVDNTGADPRNASPQLPPIPSTGVPANDQCRSATNVVAAMTSAVEAFGSELGTVGSIIALAAAIATAVVGVFAFPPSYTVLIPIVIALAQAIYSIASGTYLALFTPTVYNDLQCILYCNCDTSGTFSQTNYLDILTAIDAHGFDSNVALTFTSVIRGWGVNGLNDAARGGSVDAGDCSDCHCGSYCVDQDFTVNNGDWTNVPRAWGNPAGEWTLGQGWKATYQSHISENNELHIVSPELGCTPGYYDIAVTWVVDRWYGDDVYVRFAIGAGGTSFNAWLGATGPGTYTASYTNFNVPAGADMGIDCTSNACDYRIAGLTIAPHV